MQHVLIQQAKTHFTIHSHHQLCVYYFVRWSYLRQHHPLVLLHLLLHRRHHLPDQSRHLRYHPVIKQHHSAVYSTNTVIVLTLSPRKAKKPASSTVRNSRKAEILACRSLIYSCKADMSDWKFWEKLVINNVHGSSGSGDSMLWEVKGDRVKSQKHFLNIAEQVWSTSLLAGMWRPVVSFIKEHSIMLRRLVCIKCASHTFSALWLYSKFKVRASSSSTRLPLCKILLLSRPHSHCWASPWRKIAYSITHSLTQLILCPGRQSACASEYLAVRRLERSPRWPPHAKLAHAVWPAAPCTMPNGVIDS